MSVFWMARASSIVRPLTHSVANEDDAIAEPQPKVLNLASLLSFSYVLLSMNPGFCYRLPIESVDAVTAYVRTLKQ